MRKGWIGIVVLAGLLSVSVWWFRITRYGDTNAPIATVHANWQAAITITTNNPVIAIRMTGDVIKIEPNTPALIPLFPRETIFKDLAINGKPLHPVRKDDWFYAELTRPGEFLISGNIVTKSTYNRGEHMLTIPKPEFVTSAVTIDSGQALEVYIPNVLGRITGNITNGTHGKLPVGPTNTINVVWREPRAEVTRIGTASIKPSFAWSLQERVISGNAVLETTIEGGQADKITLQLPRDANNVKLRGAHIRDFRIEGRLLHVLLKGLFAGKTTMRLSFDIPRPTGQVLPCPNIEVVDGRIDPGGWIIISKEIRGILLEQDVAGLNPVSDLDIPREILGMAPGKPIYFYARTSREAQPVFDLVTTTPFPIIDTIADSADILTVVRPGGEEITRIAYRIRNRNRQFLRLHMPEGVKLLSARIDNKERTLSDDDGELLLPMAKSIQTLGGLVPFPVELVYCRQGEPASPQHSRVLDLPELDDVPVAAISVTVLCPEGTSLNSYRSTLKQVDTFSTRDEQPWWSSITISEPTSNNAVSREAIIEQNLAYNYYNVGYEAYKDNELEAAEQYLAKVEGLAPNASFTKDAGDLLGNIRAGRGAVKARGRLERARIARIQEEIAADNSQMEAEQQELIQTGLANIMEGDEELGADLLEQAKELSVKLGNRSTSKYRQKSLLDQYDKKLTKTKREKERNKELNKKLQQLQYQARELVQAQEPGQQQSQRFVATLVNESEKQDLDIAEAQKMAFGEAMQMAQEPQQAQAQVSGKARARQYQYSRKIMQNKTPRVQAEMKSDRKKRGSLDWRNDQLQRKVTVLKKAISAATDEAAPALTLSPEQVKRLSAIRGEIAQVDNRLDKILTKLHETNALGVTYNDVVYINGINNLSAWNHANAQAYIALDGSFEEDFNRLQEKLDGANRQVESLRAQRAVATNVIIDVSDIINPDSAIAQDALKRFIGTNYSFAIDQPDAITVKGGKMIVKNAEVNADLLNDALNSFRDNAGNVVPVSGAKLILTNASSIPVLGTNFSNRTADGRSYALLDEAEYTTLLQSGGQAAQPKSPEQRKVIVGTLNRIANEDLKISRSDANWNGILVGGTEITLAHDKYLVVDNGAYVSVLKAGEVANWQDHQEASVKIDTSDDYRVELPELGTAFLFEKVLLSAGESPDIEMEL